MKFEANKEFMENLSLHNHWIQLTYDLKNMKISKVVKASVDNTLRGLRNSLDHTKAESSDC